MNKYKRQVSTYKRYYKICDEAPQKTEKMLSSFIPAFCNIRPELTESSAS